MGLLFDKIRQAVAEERFLVSDHADERMREREIPVWQVVSGLAQGRLLRELPQAEPSPKIEVEQRLADGTAVKAVWSWVERARLARLVTVHFFSR